MSVLEGFYYQFRNRSKLKPNFRVPTRRYPNAITSCRGAIPCSCHLEIIYILILNKTIFKILDNDNSKPLTIEYIENIILLKLVLLISILLLFFFYLLSFFFLLTLSYLQHYHSHQLSRHQELFPCNLLM